MPTTDGRPLPATLPAAPASRNANTCLSTCLAVQVLPAVAKSARAAPGVDVDLRGARAAWVSPSCCLLNLASSQQVGKRGEGGGFH